MPDHSNEKLTSDLGDGPLSTDTKEKGDLYLPGDLRRWNHPDYLSENCVCIGGCIYTLD